MQRKRVTSRGRELRAYGAKKARKTTSYKHLAPKGQSENPL